MWLDSLTSNCRQLKKAELQLTAAEQAELQVKRKHDQVLGKVGEGKRALGERGKKVEDLTAEVEQLRRGVNTQVHHTCQGATLLCSMFFLPLSFLSLSPSLQEGLTSSHQAAVDGKLKEEEQIRSRVSKMSTKLQDLNKDMVVKASRGWGKP